MSTMLLSIKPKYAKVILEGKKQYEFRKNKPKDGQVLILKSWNEWGEGNYMEPDKTHGRGFINALREALEEYYG